MKRPPAILLPFVAATVLLTGCGKKDDTAATDTAPPANPPAAGANGAAGQAATAPGPTAQ